jgi:hypothetical protein
MEDFPNEELTPAPTPWGKIIVVIIVVAIIILAGMALIKSQTPAPVVAPDVDMVVKSDNNGSSGADFKLSPESEKAMMCGDCDEAGDQKAACLKSFGC